MNILGINYFFHDSTACVLTDGNLVAAIEEERLTRRKHTSEFPVRAVRKCLQMAGLHAADVDAIALSIKPTKNWHNKAFYCLSHPGNAVPFLRHELFGSLYKQRRFWHWYNGNWPRGGHRPAVHFVPHHLAHAAGAFLVSPFESAALLSIDGSGEWSTTLLGAGEGTKVSCLREDFFPTSLGSFYETATQFCGFQPNYDEGKTMGLAPLGDPETYYDEVSRLVRIDEHGALAMDLSYFDYQFWGHRRYAPRFTATFGPSRHPGEELRENHMDVAAAFQRVLEERALAMCAILRRQTGSRNLVISGGVALNCVMNGRIARESGFDDIYVLPAPGDNGTALGAAYYVHNVVHGNPRAGALDQAYLGNAYADADIAAVLKACKLPAQRHEDISAVAADLLADGQILGWHQGNMELGPRALGNRSILANPTLPHMKDKLNAEVKHREAFRPFAPAVTVEAKDEYFDVPGESPFMSKVAVVNAKHRDRLPAITHVDGTARLQTVRASTNPRFHELITRFAERTGVPVVLNTSFNVQGEPIIESPVDAIRCFFSTGIDFLIMGNYLLSKT